MTFKVKIEYLGQIWGDTEWRIVDEEGKEKILSDAKNGKWGKPQEHNIEIEDITEQVKLDNIRVIRNQYLTDSDKFMLFDHPAAADLRDRYIDYRKYLRNLPKIKPLPEKVLSFEEWFSA